MARGRAGRSGAGGRARARGCGRMGSNEYELATSHRSRPRAAPLRQPLGRLRHRARGARHGRHGAHRHRLAGHLHVLPPREPRDAARLPRERPAHQPAAARGPGPAEHYAYRCSNGLWDVAFPLVVAGEHVANIFTGQFFFADDDVDPAVFAERARRLGLRRGRVPGGARARAGHLARASAEVDQLPRRLRRHPQRDGSRRPCSGSRSTTSSRRARSATGTSSTTQRRASSCSASSATTAGRSTTSSSSTSTRRRRRGRTRRASGSSAAG